ncbi:hypothetical protein OUZ56_018854 [Daphnia magna]|uniref:ZSWIM1/3 RNaseH-like domain-containing protein n=1 Tax=Daphnia magna TaxID=35525 RepID=A0ABQ9ZA45_9CRUS|nr:hypothetical protein OUZ56_018854 [Daphnia magna]
MLTDHIELYRKKQKLKENPAAYQFATSTLAVGGNATLTRKEMSQTWGHFLKRKDLQNMKQAMTGWSSEVWQSTTEILANLTSNTENLVNVTSDEKGEMKCIYVQLSEQRRFYQRYGEVLQFDGTHSVTNTPMPLYTLIVKDNYGVGQRNNDNFITQVFHDTVYAQTNEAFIEGQEYLYAQGTPGQIHTIYFGIKFGSILSITVSVINKTKRTATTEDVPHHPP